MPWFNRVFALTLFCHWPIYEKKKWLWPFQSSYEDLSTEKKIKTLPCTERSVEVVDEGEDEEDEEEDEEENGPKSRFQGPVTF